VFAPRHEHARFCSARCRVAWNRETTSDPAAEVSVLEWSITALFDTTERLHRFRAWDRRRACAVIGEAVWWVTMVDATLVRHYPDIYDETLAGQTRAERRLIEETLAGLRFVRNQMGHGVDLLELIQPEASSPGAGAGRKPRAGVGDEPVPRVPGSASRPHHR
jgi:hypothetical protein